MEIKFENLEKINLILKLLEQLTKNQQTEDKRWLSTRQTAEYLGYSKDSIDNKVKNNVFILDTHFYQRGSKRIFDRIMLDKWVLGTDQIDVYKNSNIDTTINNIANQFTA